MLGRKHREESRLRCRSERFGAMASHGAGNAKVMARGTTEENEVAGRKLEGYHLTFMTFPSWPRGHEGAPTEMLKQG